MSVDLQLPPRLASLARALGVVRADGGVDAGWFEHPLERVQTIVSNRDQRAALLQLLDQVLPSTPGMGAGAARWYPLLEQGGRGNVFLTVDGDRIGVAASIATDATVPSARASVRLPLVETTGGTVRAVAGSAAAPLEVAVEAGFGPGAHPSSIAVIASASVEEGGSGVRVVLENVDPAAPAGTRTELDPAHLDEDAVRVLQGLLANVLAGAAAGGEEGSAAGRLARHLPGVLGMDPALPALPLARVLSDAGALRGWLAAMAASPATLQAWFAHLAGLLGADPPAASAPLRARLIELGGDASLDLTVAATGDPRVLQLGIAFAVQASAGGLEAAATLTGIPLAGTAPAAVLPAARLRVRTPAASRIVDAAPAVQVGSLAAGMAWDGARMAPLLELYDVVLDGTPYPRLELTSANAVVAAASAPVRDALAAALGEGGAGGALQVLLGLTLPADDPTAGPEYLLHLDTLLADPLRAIGDVHLRRLAQRPQDGAPPPHGWEHLFAEVAALLGLRVPVDGPAGSGTPSDPWRVALAGEAGAALELAAWNAAADEAAPQAQQLRLGLRLAAGSAPWQVAWRAELLGFDLRPDGSGATRFLGTQHLSVSLSPVAASTTGAGVAFSAASVAAAFEWMPGQPARCGLEVRDLVATGGTERVGPVSLHLPSASLDPAAPDLGLGIAPDTLMALLRLLTAEGLRNGGGDAAFVVGGLLGVHRRLGGLPADWPLLEAPGGIGALLEDPAAAVRAQVARVAGEASADGTPFLLSGLPWLRALLANELPATPANAPFLDLGVPGGGTWAHPWTLPLAGEGAQLLCWMEPDGPPAAWQRQSAERLRTAVDGPSLLLLLDDALQLLPGIEPALRDRTGAMLDRLAAWLGRSDGLSSVLSQQVAGDGWSMGASVAGPHHEQPSAPAAIAQIQARLHAWAGADTPRAVVLLSPPFADHRAWGAYLQAAEPGRAADAHFDLRAAGADPLTAELSHVNAAATHYTADLAHGDDPYAMGAQLLRVVQRVRTLTGTTKVFLVAHSTAGLVARAFAAEQPERVAGVITLGTPHAGGYPDVLADPELADAVRLAEALLPAGGRGPAGRAVAALSAALNDPRRYPEAAFAEPDWMLETVPGLAIPGRLDGELVVELARSLTDRAVAAAGTVRPPTHFAYGARVAFGPSEPDEVQAGDVEVHGRIRVDAGRRAFSAGAGEPARPARALSVRVEVERAGGWLVGDADVTTGVRLRRAELGVDVEPGVGGGASVRPVVRLFDAGASPEAGLDDLLPRLPSLPRFISLGTLPALPGSSAAWLADALEALGLLVRDATGAVALDVDELAALASDVARFGARLPELLNRLAVATGTGWAIRPADAPVEVVIEREPWRVRVRLRDARTGADTLALGPGLRIAAEAGVGVPDFAPAAAARLELADARIAWSTASRAVTLSAAPWLEPVALVPPAPPPVLRAALARAVPVLAGATVVSGVLNGLLAPGMRVRGVTRLLTAPGAWLVSPDALGAADGSGLDPLRVDALLTSIGTALGLGTGGGLHLPGDLTLSAGGHDPLRLELNGSLQLGAPDADAPRDVLDLRLALAIDQTLAASPSGRLTLDVAVPGGFTRVAITAGADASGISLAVTPGSGPPITLLPRFSGFGDLALGAAALLPTVLQAVVEALKEEGAIPAGLPFAALKLAEALGIYGFDAEGFLATARVQRLQAMTRPGWLEDFTGSAPDVIGALVPILAHPDPLLDLPGTITAAHDAPALLWEIPAGEAGGKVTARLGWSPVAGAPDLGVGLTDLRLGPVHVGALRAGYDGAPRASLALGVQPDGPLAFLRPALTAGVDGAGRFTLSLLPLGEAHAAELAVRVAPDPAVVLGPGGAIALVERWGAPLAGTLLLGAFAGRLDRELWTDGPTVQQVLLAAEVAEFDGSTLVVAHPLPAPGAAALGALKAAAATASLGVDVTPDLRLSLAQGSEGRIGIRLEGSQPLGDAVSLRFGEAEWVGDDAGVTLWLLTGTGTPRIAPELDVAGLGVVVQGENGAPLLDGAFGVGSAGGFLFLHARFTDDAGNPALQVDGLGAGAEIRGARIRVSADGADGFLKTVLPPELQAPFDLGVGWRNGALALYGGTPGDGLELAFPLEVDLAAIQLSELVVALRSRGGAAQVEGAVSGNARLGLVRAAVRRVGVKATLGPDGVQVGFRSPDGVGIAIDAGVVVGGGYLEVDAGGGHYAGAIQLEMQGLSLTAVGILSTRGPEGEDLPGGFSLLVVIAAELPPVQLGFGFTLNGIGGLLGLNRAIGVDALRAGVRNRGLDAILFPPDPIANAPALVRTLGTVFPVAAGRFVVGPMVRLGWGTPPILTLDLGILVELPAPVVVAVVGRMKLALPREDARAIVLIHMDVLGVVNFERGEVSIDAELYDSFVAGFALSGGMALRARWKEKPAFALSIGGFHPAFEPPADFPTLNRLALSLSSGNNPRLRLEAYLAVTSNTVQFGAAIDLHAEALGFEVDGHLGFDALIYLDPFGLDVSLDASVSVKWRGSTVCAVGLHLRVRGPGPWHVQGEAHIDLLLVSATVRFDAKIGEADPPAPPPPVRVERLLREAMTAPENWTAQAPEGESVVVLRSPPGQARPAAHPLGGLTVRQRVAPMKVGLQRFGAAGVDGPRRFAVSEVRLGDQPVHTDDVKEVRDPFAAGQFFDLTETQKLTRPSFEQYASGVTLRFDGFKVDTLAADEAAVLGYRLVLVDDEEDGTTPAGVTLDADRAAELAHGGAAARAESRRSGLRRFAAPAARIGVRERGFSVTRAADARTAVMETAPTWAEALEAAEALGAGGEALAVVATREERQ